MALYKEIVTKAIIGKGKKSFSNTYEVETTDIPTNVLGCWVINHKFKGYKSGDKIGIDGSFDVNIWYSYDNDSKTTVINKKIEYNELVNVKTKEDANISNDVDIIVRVLKQPNCTKVSVKDSNIVFDIEKELGVELVGEAKVKISAITEDDSWDDIDNELNEEVDDEINKINENYIN